MVIAADATQTVLLFVSCDVCMCVCVRACVCVGFVPSEWWVQVHVSPLGEKAWSSCSHVTRCSISTPNVVVVFCSAYYQHVNDMHLVCWWKDSHPHTTWRTWAGEILKQLTHHGKTCVGGHWFGWRWIHFVSDELVTARTADVIVITVMYACLSCYQL